jgi:hypothetical protein
MTSLGKDVQVDYSSEELLASHPGVEPLIVGGVRCHGGFDREGNYVPPRTLNRVPAIKAWQAKRQAESGTPILDVPLETWPEHYPNLPQARFLLEQKVEGPLVSTLTRIGTVEGFGAAIRHVPLPELDRCFDEGISGTALAHLGRGLYEAHARDEAGFGDTAGHQQMWFAARDVAFDAPVDEVVVQGILARMGFGNAAASVDPDEARRRAIAARVTPADLPYELEAVINFMARVLLIEISAFHTFAWAEALLSDTDLVAGDGAAARIVSYIRQDETPHVEYLKTALSEMRDRTFLGQGGRKYAGTEVVEPLWAAALDNSLGAGRQQTLSALLNEVTYALADRPDGKDILEQFHLLGSIRPSRQGAWTNSGGEPLTY